MRILRRASCRPSPGEIPRPIGPVHFAGEHTELVAPGLEGAVVSGMRAAAEVLEAERLTPCAGKGRYKKYISACKQRFRDSPSLCYSPITNSKQDKLS